MALFALQNAIGPLRDPISSALSRAFDGILRQRVMTAVLEPRRASATSKIRSFGRKSTSRAALSVWSGTRVGPSGASQHLDRPPRRRRQPRDRGVVLMARPRILLAVVALIVVRTKRAMYLRMSIEVTGNAEELRRARWYRDLSLTPEAAKETRVFGLAPGA